LEASKRKKEGRKERRRGTSGASEQASHFHPSEPCLLVKSPMALVKNLKELASDFRRASKRLPSPSPPSPPRYQPGHEKRGPRREKAATSARGVGQEDDGGGDGERKEREDDDEDEDEDEDEAA
jgi:hypothetical protein